MAEEYLIQCWSCLGEYDAVASVWCSCDPKNPSKLCPYCLQCFCSSSDEYKSRFWEYAPPSLVQERSSLRKIKDRLGELLVRAQVVTVEDILIALSRQMETGDKLGQLLVKNQFLTSEELETFLEMQSMVVPSEFAAEDIDTSMLERLNAEFCLQRKIVPMRVFKTPNRSFLMLAMANPQDSKTIDIVIRKTEMLVVPFYGDEFNISGFLMKMIPPGGARIVEQETIDYQTMIRKMIIDAIRRRASDIHIEPDQSEINVRYRIDGVLYKVKSPPKHDQSQVISSLKRLAKMDLQNSHLPQSSKMILRVGEERYQLNTLTFPNPHGESISIKIVNLSTFLRDLSDIGLTPEQYAMLRTTLDSTAGLLVISGPLMNGVSTTQYAMLKYLSNSNRKVMTLESPIFSNIKNIHQSEINPAVGFDFTTGLSSIVQSDPDVIFVSDIPDAEVAATICKTAARCVVVAALNAISAANAIVMLHELGASSSLLSQSLSLVVNQRLVRKICPHCSEKSPISESLLVRMGLSKQEAQGLNAYAGAGCKSCNFLGFSGRVAIFEVMQCTSKVLELVGRNASAREIERAALKQGTLTLRQLCLKGINDGITTIEEFQKSKF